MAIFYFLFFALFWLINIKSTFSIIVAIVIGLAPVYKYGISQILEQISVKKMLSTCILISK